MFSRPDFPGAVSDIQVLVGQSDAVAGDLDDATRSRLMRTRQAITARRRMSGHGRTWWPDRPQRKHHRVAIGCVLVPALLAATAAGWAIAGGPSASRVTAAVVCYSLPHLPELGISEAAAGGTAGSISPTALCARQWAAGEVVAGVHHVPASLVACANASLGEVAVFPDTTCAAVHLPPLPADYGTAARRYGALTSALADGLIGSGGQSRCVGEAVAVSFTRQTLRSHGFDNWRIIPPRNSGVPECWQALANPATQTIQIVPQPGVYPPSVAGAERVIRTALSVPAGACRSGNTPENAAATIRKLRAALRQAGDGTWTVVLRQPTTRQLPCYEQVQFPPGNHSVQLSPVAFAGSSY
jgi:hypothetical protein